MKTQNKSIQSLALVIGLLAAQIAPALAAGLVPHIYNRGVHGHLDLTSAKHLLVLCPELQFGQLYLGSSQGKDEHFMQNGIVPGGHYGRQDRARLERCTRQNQQ